MGRLAVSVPSKVLQIFGMCKTLGKKKRPEGRFFGVRTGPLQLLRSIVTLHRPCLDKDAGVALLPVLGLGCYRPRDVAGSEAEGGAHCRQGGNEHGDDDSDDLFFRHSSPPF